MLCHKYSLFLLFLLALECGILVEEEENGEDNKTTESSKDSDVVRRSFEEISLIFVVLERSDSNLSGRVQERVSWLSESDLELENTVFIRSSEAGDVFGCSFLVSKGHSDVRVQHDELQLKFARDERLPSLLLKVVGNYASFVGDIIEDLVFGGLEGVIALEVMENAVDSDVSSQLEGPVGDAETEVFIGALTLDEELVTEKIERSGDDDSGVVSTLDGSSQDEVASSVEDLVAANVFQSGVSVLSSSENWVDLEVFIGGDAQSDTSVQDGLRGLEVVEGGLLDEIVD